MVTMSKQTMSSSRTLPIPGRVVVPVNDMYTRSPVDGGVVTVRTRAGSHGEVVVEVQDDGPGIPLEVRERIFEVFYSSRGGGTGLGLPIARQIIERHGGTIEVDSVEGQGTTFRIRLPRHHRRAADSPASDKTVS